ncbi:MAG: hypothetical protein ABI920_06735 [Casimicrobiaceae bacterium]
MNRNLLKTSLALAATGLLTAGGALAQSNTPSGTQSLTAPSKSSPTSQYNNPSATPSTTTSAVPANGQSGNTMGLPDKTESASSAFNKLDARHRGYVTADEVTRLRGIDFASADKNHDGKLDATEFNAAWAGYAKNAK